MINMIKRSSTYLLLLTIITFSACNGNKTEKKQAIPAISNQANETATIGLEIGNRAPELAFPSPEGKTITLSDLKGKLVLIDFWASWCMPCRIENPNLVKVYNNYKNKEFTVGEGFTIFSVSLDTKVESWISGIQNDGLAWESHVSDLKGWYSVPAAMYQVSSIPASFLIDGNGIIIAKNLRAEALESTMKGLLN